MLCIFVLIVCVGVCEWVCVGDCWGGRGDCVDCGGLFW